MTSGGLKKVCITNCIESLDDRVFMQIIGHCINCTIQPKILDFLKVGFKKYIPKIALDGSSEGF